MVQSKVADDIRSLDIIRVRIKCRQKPRIFCSNKLATGLVCPQLRELASRKSEGLQCTDNQDEGRDSCIER